MDELPLLLRDRLLNDLRQEAANASAFFAACITFRGIVWPARADPTASSWLSALGAHCITDTLSPGDPGPWTTKPKKSSAASTSPFVSHVAPKTGPHWFWSSSPTPCAVARSVPAPSLSPEASMRRLYSRAEAWALPCSPAAPPHASMSLHCAQARPSSPPRRLRRAVGAVRWPPPALSRPRSKPQAPGRPRSTHADAPVIGLPCASAPPSSPSLESSMTSGRFCCGLVWLQAPAASHAGRTVFLLSAKHPQARRTPMAMRPPWRSEHRGGRLPKRRKAIHMQARTRPVAPSRRLLEWTWPCAVTPAIGGVQRKQKEGEGTPSRRKHQRAHASPRDRVAQGPMRSALPGATAEAAAASLMQESAHGDPMPDVDHRPPHRNRETATAGQRAPGPAGQEARERRTLVTHSTPRQAGAQDRVCQYRRPCRADLAVKGAL